MLKKIYFLFFIVFLQSCFPLTPNSLKKISVNDSKESVIKVLGTPYTKKAYYNKEFLVYYLHDDLFSFIFNLKQFPFIGFYPFLRTGTEYWVIIEDDRVVSFGASSNFGNSVPRALNDKSAVLDLGAN